MIKAFTDCSNGFFPRHSPSDLPRLNTSIPIFSSRVLQPDEVLTYTYLVATRLLNWCHIRLKLYPQIAPAQTLETALATIWPYAWDLSSVNLFSKEHQ